MAETTWLEPITKSNWWKLSKVKVYINPFDDNGLYTSFIDVTRDVISLGQIKQQLDHSEYDLGIFRNANVSLKMQNNFGRYSSPGESVTTIFKFKRSNSKVRITWQPGNDPLICGFFKSGEILSVLSEEVTVFEGLLNDDATKSDIEIQDVDFKALGYDSILDTLLVPFSSLGTETISSLIFKMLDQVQFRSLVNLGSISPFLDSTLDTVAPLENKKVRDVLREVLLISNSVFYIRNGEYFVAPRVANALPDPAYQFYGEAADFGIENIVDIKDYRVGLNRTFNFWTWQDTVLAATDSSSATKYGFRAKQLSNDSITDNGKRQAILNANRDEFGSPRREFKISTYLTPAAIGVFLNDKISVDYPSIGVSESGQKVAVYDQPTGYEVDYYATDVFMIQILKAERWKVLATEIDLKNDTISYEVREIIS